MDCAGKVCRHGAFPLTLNLKPLTFKVYPAQSGTTRHPAKATLEFGHWTVSVHTFPSRIPDHVSCCSYVKERHSKSVTSAPDTPEALLLSPTDNNDATFQTYIQASHVSFQSLRRTRLNTVPGRDGALRRLRPRPAAGNEWNEPRRVLGQRFRRLTLCSTC
jgi:hypothetical protein